MGQVGREGQDALGGRGEEGGRTQARQRQVRGRQMDGVSAFTCTVLMIVCRVGLGRVVVCRARARLQQRRHDAAVHIQRMVRGRLARNHTSTLRFNKVGQNGHETATALRERIYPTLAHH